MISLRKTATELERLEGLAACLSECYRLAIRASADCAIELDAGEAAEFRERLRALAGAPGTAESCAGVRRMHSGFRNALREYRSLTQGRVDHLRNEVEAGAAALAALTSDLSATGDDHQEQMNRELERLREMCGWQNPADIRRGLESAIAGIARAVERMQAAHRMIIAQLRDEIRTLHEHIEFSRRAVGVDSATGAWTREKTAERLEDLLREDQVFWVVLVTVANFERLQSRYSPPVVASALQAVVAGLRELAGPQPVIGRWSCGEFLVLLEVDPSDAMTLAREAPTRLSTSYIISGAPASMPVPLEIATGTLERTAACAREAFFKKLDQLSAALHVKS